VPVSHLNLSPWGASLRTAGSAIATLARPPYADAEDRPERGERRMSEARLPDPGAARHSMMGSCRPLGASRAPFVEIARVPDR
jgi:hypothetical protein